MNHTARQIMVEFRYEATDQNGKPIVGQLSSGTLREAIEEVRGRGLNVRRVEPLRVEDEAVEVEEFLTPLPAESAANIAELFGEAIEHQLPLEPALRAAAQEAPASEARVLNRLANSIAAGTPPEKAFAEVGQALPMGLSAVIQVGIQSGNLPKLLSHYVTLSRRGAGIRTALVMALLYPALLTLGLLAVLVFSLTVMVPQFQNIFDDFGSDLPAITESLLWVSALLTDHTLYVGFGVLALAGVLFFVFLVLRRHRHVFTRIAIFDWLTRTSEWGRFCGLLSLMVQADQPMPRALRIVSVSVASPRVQFFAERLAANIEAGYSPWEASHVAGIPGPIRHSLRWANNPDFFTEALDGLAEIYDRQNRRIFVLLPLLLEPILLMGISLVMGYVVVALFMPLLQLLNDLS